MTPPSSRRGPFCGFKLKGTAVRGTLQAIEKLHGVPGRIAVEERLAPELREILTEGVIAAGWYPVELNAQMHIAVRDLFGNGSWAVSRSLGREAAKIDFGGVYRVLLRAVPHATLWERVGLAWNQYNSAGSSRWEVTAPGVALGTMADCEGYNEGLWESAAGRLETMLERSGVRARAVTFLEMSAHGSRAEVLWIE